ncbi:MAG: D-alanine--D-alanine ligase [Gemmatimonadales bacterium]
MKVALLTGGASSERDVALASGLQIAAALRERGHVVSMVDLAAGSVPQNREALLLPQGIGREPPPFGQLKAQERRMLSAGLGELAPVKEADVVFLALHGGQGENGTVQALLDAIGVPYTGSGRLASALAFDKDMAKRVWQGTGIPVPRWIMAPADLKAVREGPGFPCVVKPSNEGSSVGLTLVKDPKDLDAAIALASRYDTEVMVEEYIAGRELTVGIVGADVLPVIEIVAKHELFDYECKYTPGMADEFPAVLEPENERRLQQTALAAHRALKLGGYSRIDFRADAKGDIFCLEANTLPGMTAGSLIPKAARAAGMSFADLVDRICHLALERGGTKPRAGG